MLHLVARLPRGAPSQRLIPLLGRKEEPRDRRGPKRAPGRPRSAALSGAGTSGGFQGWRPRGLPPSLGAPLLEGQAASAARYGTAALHPVPRSIASPAATLAAEPCPPPPPGAEPAPATHPRAQTHASPTNTRVHTHKHVCAHTRTPTDADRLVGTCVCMIRALLTGWALVSEDACRAGGCKKPADFKVEDNYLKNTISSGCFP